MTILSLELNELNVNYIKQYADMGYLPNFSKIIDSDAIAKTISEPSYPYLEPWIQWPTVYTGLPQSEHGLFRLGDSDNLKSDQVWEKLEKKGFSVGAICPMNAANRCDNPDFFIPDPWTDTRLVGDKKLADVYKIVRALVNDNASINFSMMHMLKIALKTCSFFKLSAFLRIMKDVPLILRYKWAKAAVLDMLFFSICIRLIDKHRSDFCSIFLNAAAHIQHHHTYDATAYNGDKRNPAWYSDARESGVDPLLFIYKYYDWMLGYLASRDDISVVMATGLSQLPNEVDHFQYRIADLDGFNELFAVDGITIKMRMSRDFLITGDLNSLKNANNMLQEFRVGDMPLFNIDDRGDSLFCQVSYFGAPEALKICLVNGLSMNLSGMFVLVSVENGIHQTTGYVADIDNILGSSIKGNTSEVPLENLHGLILDAFTRLDNHTKPV